MNIASMAAHRGSFQHAHYSAAKGGVLSLSRSLAVELAPRNIRVNAVSPGLIDTPLGRLASAGRPSRKKSPIPLGRQGTATEVAHAVVFLLSDESSYITGHDLVVDGGLSTLT